MKKIFDEIGNRFAFFILGIAFAITALFSPTRAVIAMRDAIDNKF